MGDIKQAKRGQKASSKETSKETSKEVSLRKVSEGLQQLSPNAVRLLREIYSLIDNDSTGAVGRNELKQMIQSVGLTCNDAMLDDMIARTGEPVSFASFLAVMADKMGKLPDRDELDGVLDAFNKDGGTLDMVALKESLVAEGLSTKEVQQFIEGFSKRTAQGQQFDRKQFVTAMSI